MSEANKTDEETQQSALIQSSKKRPEDVAVSDVVVKPLDGGWGWFVMIGYMLQLYFTVGLGKSFTLLYIEMLDRFRQSNTMTSFTIAIQLFTHMSFTLVTGILCNRFKVRSLALIGCVFFISGMVISSYATSIYVLYFSYGILVGIGQSMRVTPGMVILNQYFKKKKAMAFGLVTASKGLAAFTVPPFIAYLLATQGWTGTMLLYTGLAMHTFVGAMLFRPLKDNFKRRKHTLLALKVQSSSPEGVARERDDISDSRPEANGKSDTVDLQNKTQNFKSQKNPKTKMIHLDIMKNCKFLCFLFGLFFFNCGLTTMAFLAPLGKEQGFSSSEITIAVTVYGVADLISALVIGVLFDLRQVRGKRYHIYYMLFFFDAVGSFGLGMVRKNYALYIGSVIVKGLTINAFWMRVPIISDIVGDEKVASALALSAPLSGIGQLIGPIIGGLLTDKLGSYTYVMHFAGVVNIAACLTTCLGAFLSHFCFKNTKRQPCESK